MKKAYLTNTALTVKCKLLLIDNKSATIWIVTERIYINYLKMLHIVIKFWWKGSIWIHKRKLKTFLQIHMNLQKILLWTVRVITFRITFIKLLYLMWMINILFFLQIGAKFKWFLNLVHIEHVIPKINVSGWKCKSSLILILISIHINPHLFINPQYFSNVWT